MCTETIPERAYRILEILASNGNVSQRTLAHKTGISHGLANIILRRCIRIGLVKSQQVSGRRFKYFLTPKGLAHITRCSIGYVQKTLESYHALRQGMEGLADRLVAEGNRHFVILGEGDIPDIMKLALSSRPGVTYEIRTTLEGNGSRGRREASRHEPRARRNGTAAAILDCRWQGGDIGISVLHEVLFQEDR